jgi:hypothetical protein
VATGRDFENGVSIFKNALQDMVENDPVIQGEIEGHIEIEVHLDQLKDDDYEDYDHSYHYSY